MDPKDEPKVYLLPNLMTAGNLFCGFGAVLSIIEAALVIQKHGSAGPLYHETIAFILGACVFDLLDGRVARLGGTESPFGREFDSLADIVSFGMAPALLAYQVVLQGFPRAGWLIAFAYLLCGALRLARFNCYAMVKTDKPSDEFVGFPIPAAAGLIASLTLFMLWVEEDALQIGWGKFILPALLLFLSGMMFSRVKYPSFKGLGWRSQRSIPHLLVIAVVLALCAVFYQWMPAVLFVSFLLYGFVRPYISKALRREIEEEEGDEPIEEDETPKEL
ncbi:CDP-diacylglycerol--serine O-phosphatidyltransferase [soil metagenome]